MKKLTMILTALLIVAVGVLFTVSAQGDTDGKTFISPTAPTITVPSVTVTQPTVPGVISTIPTSPVPGTTGVVTVPTGTPAGTTRIATTKSPAATGTRVVLTTPDGSTVTDGTAKPDENPESPKTGGASMEVFAFAAIALAAAGSTVVLKKHKATDAQ